MKKEYKNKISKVLMLLIVTSTLCGCSTNKAITEFYDVGVTSFLNGGYEFKGNEKFNETIGSADGETYKSKQIYITNQLAYCDAGIKKEEDVTREIYSFEYKDNTILRDTKKVEATDCNLSSYYVTPQNEKYILEFAGRTYKLRFLKDGNETNVSIDIPFYNDVRQLNDIKVSDKYIYLISQRKCYILDKQFQIQKEHEIQSEFQDACLTDKNQLLLFNWSDECRTMSILNEETLEFDVKGKKFPKNKNLNTFNPSETFDFVCREGNKLVAYQYESDRFYTIIDFDNSKDGKYEIVNVNRFLGDSYLVQLQSSDKEDVLVVVDIKAKE